METFNVKAASLAIAAALAAVAPFVNGYFAVKMEIGNDIIAEVGAQKNPRFEVLSYRVWKVGEDGEEIAIKEALDTDIIEDCVNKEDAV